MILLIDNYDSFSYNLVQLIGKLLKGQKETGKEEIRVIRNDEMSLEKIEALKPSRLILSPGPGRPSQAGICEKLIKEFKRNVPILGVCLGHQAICEAFGATITYADQLMHGKQSDIELDLSCPLFQGLNRVISVARYHSLVAKRDTLPDELIATAVDVEKKEIMAVMHKSAPIYGLQFHPESVLTPDGEMIIRNFLFCEKISNLCSE